MQQRRKWRLEQHEAKSGDIHVHCCDRYDAGATAEEICKRSSELGAKAIALTGHGVASQVENFKKASKKYGLKFVPGIEAYYKTDGYERHLIILAMDDTGWKAMCVAISKSQDKNGRAVMNEETLRKYFGKDGIGHGHVIATSACINGVIAGVLRENESIEREIRKVTRRMEKACKGMTGTDRLEAIEEDIRVIEGKEKKSREHLEQLKAEAGMKFSKREKAIEKIKDEEQARAARKLLEEDKKAAKEAEEMIPQARRDADLLKKRLSAMRKERKEILDIVEKYNAYQEEIEDLKGGLEEEDVIEENAEEELFKFLDIFGKDNFYMEVQNHGIDIEAEVYPKLAEMARKYSVPIVASNDVHTVTNSEEELLRRRMLRSLRFETWSEDQPGDDQLYIKTDREMAEWLLRILPQDIVEEAMDNITNLFDRCDVRFEVHNHYPRYVPENGQTDIEWMKGAVNRWLNEKFPNGVPEEYRKRMDRELGIIDKMGFVSYHGVVHDFLDFAGLFNYIPPDQIKYAPTNREELKAWIKERGYTKKIGVSTGAGRGSAAGSLVCNALDITKLDPIKYTLLFERFLNPERVSMPDIDSDISRMVRPKVIEYVKNKYGEECVCGIMTQNAQAPKGAIRNAAKCYGLYKNRDNKKDNGAKRFLSLADQIAKKVPDEVGITFSSKVEGGVTLFQSLLSEYRDDEDAAEIVRWGRVFEGCFTAYGAHAAGIVITDGTPVCEIVPLRWNDKLGIYTTQCDMVEVEENGMLKFDFLGLKTLDVINDCLWQLNREGISLNIYDIPLNDKKVLKEIFAKGQTDSVFQFESSGMKQMLRRFKPEKFEDLILLVAMFRPGPLQYLDGVIDVKNGVKPLEFLDERLRPILEDTYGAISYQEQVMRIFQDLAGYSLGQADLVRRAMSKKKMSVLEKERRAFVYGDPERNITGCVNNGIRTTIANELFDQMIEFAKYAFNMSHAAVYAYNAYITGHLKYYYPAEFLMAAMNWAEKTQRKDPIPGLMAEAKSMGVDVRQPDINASGARFTVENGSILFGLGAVKTVGVSADAILQERKEHGPFLSFHDFFRRCPVKKDAVENLIAAGAFDGFYPNRLAMERSVVEFKKAADAVRKKESFIKSAEAMLPYVDGIYSDEKIKEKQAALGVSVELKEVTTRKKLEVRIRNAKDSLAELKGRFDSLKVDLSIKEDKTERMNRERELLGAYVTSHPLDEYEAGIEGSPIRSISEITLNTRRIFGVIKDVQIKKRKADGKPMAFVNLEDKSGTIKVRFFTDPYDRCKDDIEVGKVVVVTGNAKEEDVFGSSDDQEKEFVFDAKNIHAAKKKRRKFFMTVHSYATFHLFDEPGFRADYEEADGNDLLIFDQMMEETREASYKISDLALSNGTVTEI